MAENGDNEKMAALEAKICHQIEYYFGDFNLPRDKFLKEQIKLDEGWVPLEIMIKFNRLNRLTTDFNVIVEALSKSKAELMEISEDKTKIRRSPNKPLPEVTDEYKNDVKNRSVYIVSPFICIEWCEPISDLWLLLRNFLIALYIFIEISRRKDWMFAEIFG
uniref:HTH La-type RNA-binding domain-containing protein n=1 Tax=Prolemur simus TaxID=1328070 RepID=A0A8C9AIS0_PROSS